MGQVEFMPTSLSSVVLSSIVTSRADVGKSPHAPGKFYNHWVEGQTSQVVLPPTFAAEVVETAGPLSALHGCCPGKESPMGRSTVPPQVHGDWRFRLRKRDFTPAYLKTHELGGLQEKVEEALAHLGPSRRTRECHAGHCPATARSGGSILSALLKGVTNGTASPR
jgi:hypothetical protein